MKKSTKGEAVLSGFQIQASRLNKLEYRRLQQNVNLMNDDLKIHLANLQRQAHDIRHHYANVVRTVKPNPKYQLWKQIHAYEIAQDENQNWLESLKLRRKSKGRLHGQRLSTTEDQLEPIRPLLVLLGNDIKKPVEPTVINFDADVLRPGTSPMQKNLPIDPHRKTPLWAIINERPIKSSNPFRSNRSERNGTSFLPSIASPDSRKIEHSKSALNMTQKTANIDALYRIALQNQTVIGKPKLLDKQFTTQNETNRVASLVK